jgi:hypothetical protein
MRSSKPWKELTAVVVVFSLLCVFLPPSPAVGGWMPTRAAVNGPKARLITLLERKEIAETLESLGVDPQEAARRVAGLTDAEAQAALDRFDALPAGGDSAFGLIVGALVLIFVVLLVTDLLGLTRFYPFTKKR